MRDTPWRRSTSQWMTARTGSIGLLGQCRLRTLEPIQCPGFCQSELEPVASDGLQLDEELLAPLDGRLVEVSLQLELVLKRELSDERLVFSSRAPHPHVGSGGHPFAEVEDAECPAALPR